MDDPSPKVGIALPTIPILSSIFTFLTFTIFLIFVLFSPENKGEWSYPDVILSVPNHVRGNFPVTEIAQDIYGFRALIFDLDPYAILNDVMPILGTEWQNKSPTTHPPTAFLFGQHPPRVLTITDCFCHLGLANGCYSNLFSASLWFLMAGFAQPWGYYRCYGHLPLPR